MTEKTDNKEALKAAESTLSGRMNAFAEAVLGRAGSDLLKDMVKNKAYSGFTGQTQTSYMCGYYEQGKPVFYLEQSEYGEAPRRGKIPKGETVYLDDPYEGKPRAVTGAVEVNGKSGAETSAAFLKKLGGESPGWSLIAATGTEYSEYLEDVRDVNVMSNTFGNAVRIFRQSVKVKMKED